MLDRKYERQMSGKEKRKFEAEKMRQMTLKEKIEYLWMYYKILFLIPVIIGVVIYLGVTMYQGITREVLLNLTILDGTGTELPGLEEDIKDLLGTGNSKETVEINSNLSGSTDDYNSNVALSTLIGAESVDVLICTEEVYEQYNDQNGFVNLEELLSEETLAGGKVQEDAVILEKNDYMTEKMGVSYEPAYVCVMENAKHKENAVAFVEMLLENVS